MANALADILMASTVGTEFTFEEYLTRCRSEPLLYATAAQRLRSAIGDGEPIDMSDPKNTRLFESMNSVRRYDVFRNFYGIERTIQNIVNYIDGAAKGLQPFKQMLLLVGEPSTGKSSLALRLLQLMEVHPMPVLKIKGVVSPFFDSPLCIFTDKATREAISSEYGIPLARLQTLMSPWVHDQLLKNGGDLSTCRVVLLKPSLSDFTGLARVEPYDERETKTPSPIIEGLARTSQGLLELVEPFRTPWTELYPFISATEDRSYTVPGERGVRPYYGIIVAHSNLEQWEEFRNDEGNKAFVSRLHVIKVPHTTQLSAEKNIYLGQLNMSGISEKQCAPHTLELLAALAVGSRISSCPNMYPTIRVFNGEDPKILGVSKKLPGLRALTDGLHGLHPRWLSAQLCDAITSGADNRTNPVDLLEGIRSIFGSGAPGDKYRNIATELLSAYVEIFSNELRKAYFEDSATYCQEKFTYYVSLINALDEGSGYKDPDTGEQLAGIELTTKIALLEIKMGITTTDLIDFRQKLVRYTERHRSINSGVYPAWLDENSYSAHAQKLMTLEFPEIWKIIVQHRARDEKAVAAHTDFMSRMSGMGYTESETRRLVDWWIQQKVTSGENIPTEK